MRRTLDKYNFTHIETTDGRFYILHEDAITTVAREFMERKSNSTANNGHKDLLAELYERLEIQKKLIYDQLADARCDKQELHMMEGKEQLLIELIEFYSKKSL